MWEVPPFLKIQQFTVIYVHRTDDDVYENQDNQGQAKKKVYTYILPEKYPLHYYIDSLQTWAAGLELRPEEGCPSLGMQP